MNQLELQAFLVCQSLVVLFIALHDWIPLRRLNNLAGIHEVDSTGALLRTTVISTLPFAICLAASVHYRATGFPGWLWNWLWICYVACFFGVLRAWYIPYLFGGDRDRAARYQKRFAGTHAFLPVRNGIVPDTLHVIFHTVLICTLILLGLLSFS